MQNSTEGLETIKDFYKGMHAEKGEHHFKGNVQCLYKYTSLVDIYMPFILKMEAYSREIGKNDLADWLMQKKDEVIVFLKSTGWTHEEMKRGEWFINNNGVHCFGQKANDNKLTPNCNCAFISNGFVFIATHRDSAIDEEKSNLLLIVG